jgi:Ca2+-binding EF-hand superfamily protein
LKFSTFLKTVLDF